MLKASKKVVFLAAVVSAFALAGCASHGAKQAAESTPTPTEAPSNINTNSAAEQAAQRLQALQQAAQGQHSIYFATNESNIEPQYQGVVDNWSKYLLAAPTVKIQIQGNTDERGMRAYNQALGERRAESVQSALEAEGVPAAQLSTTSFGKERPVCTEHAESCWHLNRRADLVTQ